MEEHIYPMENEFYKLAQSDSRWTVHPVEAKFVAGWCHLSSHDRFFLGLLACFAQIAGLMLTVMWDTDNK